MILQILYSGDYSLLSYDAATCQESEVVRPIYPANAAVSPPPAAADTTTSESLLRADPTFSSLCPRPCRCCGDGPTSAKQQWRKLLGLSSHPKNPPNGPVWIGFAPAVVAVIRVVC